MDNGYATAIPVADWPGRAQGAAPKLIATLNTFLPDARGMNVPVKLHPRLVAAENVPVEPIFIATLSPVRLVVDHDPMTLVRDAIVL